MTRSVLRVLAALGVVALATVRCSNPGGATAPTTTAVTITETFANTLAPAGELVFPFNATTAGSIAATLTSITPDTTLVLGMSLGIWDGTSCSQQISVPMAPVGSSVNGNVSGAGSLCVLVFDSNGTLTGPEQILVTIVHS